MTKRKLINDIMPYPEPSEPDYAFLRKTEALPYFHCVGVATEGADPRHNPLWNQVAKGVIPFVSMDWVNKHYIRKEDVGMTDGD